MLQSRQVWIIFAIVAGTIGLATPTPARAAPATVKVVDISGPSPFAPDGCGVDISQLGSEYEPDLAVNPKDQRNIIAIWSQDKQISNVVAASHDGGEHWTQVLVPGLSKCTGGTADSALDARVSFGSDGAAYLSSQVVDNKHGRLFWTLVVNRSSDGGLSWSDPVTIDQAGPYPVAALDFPVLVADPRRPATAYVVWSRFHDLFTAPAAPQFFARTTDGGVTWTPPAMMPITPQSNRTAFSSQIRVLPDGTLVNVFIQIPVDVAPIGPTSVWAMRSQDQGDSWSAPIFVADIPENVVTDPDNGRGLAGGVSFVTPSVATGPGSEVYVAWHLIESTSSSRILFAKSLNGGTTWGAPTALAVEGTQAFKPTVAVSPSGIVGVTYFDFRGDVPGDAQLTTDVWFRHSRDGATWSETHVAGPFDIRPAPYPGAFPLGDYFGLTPIANDGFGAIFVQTISPQTAGVTDVFFARVQVPPAPKSADGSSCTLSPGRTGGGRLFAWLIVPMLTLYWARRHTAALACTALCVASAHMAQAGINVWTTHGPGSGSVGALAIDPTTPSTMYAAYLATAGGSVFKSTNGAGTWGAASVGLPNTDVYALAIDPLTPRTLYAATNGAGVFKSSDGAANWQAVNTGLTNTTVRGLAIDPATPSTLYAATEGGLFKSTDGGSTWDAADTGLSSTSVRAVVIDPTTPSTLYTARDLIVSGGTIPGGVFKSTDGGSVWYATGLTSTFVIALAIDPTTPSTLYAGGSGDGVFKSTDGGQRWEAASAGLPSTIMLAIAIDPAAPSTLYAGTSDGVFKSGDGASTWGAVNTGITNFYVRALAIDPNPSSTLYAATFGSGVLKSTDGATAWNAVNTGVSNTEVLAVAIDPTAPNTLYAAAGFGGVFKSTDAGSTWDTVSTGLTDTYVRALAIDPTIPGTLYAATGTGISKSYGGPPGSVFKSTDAGRSWNDTVFPGDDTVPVTAAGARIGIGIGGFRIAVVAILIDPDVSRTLYAVTNIDGVHKSTDGGNSWHTVNTGLADTNGGTLTFTPVSALAIDPAAPTRLYVAKGLGGGVFKSTDGAGSWLATGLTNTDIHALAVDPTTAGTLYAASDTVVFKSTDGAGSWNTITDALSSPSIIRALVIEPTTPSTLYAGTFGGVFKSTDGASSWHVVNTGLTNTNVGDLAIDSFTPSTLYAGTFGGGVFSIQQITVSPCIGDCDDSNTVTIDNLLTLVNIALGTAAISECAAGDRNQDNAISVDEILAAVNNALSTCPVPSTPTPTMTPTITPTRTRAPTPTPTPAVLATSRATGR